MKVTKISKSQYEALKETYLHKNRCMYSLYRELNGEIEIDKQIFFRIINKIRAEEGLKPFYYSKKQNKTLKIKCFGRFFTETLFFIDILSIFAQSLL